jgi:hypothetical protein
VLARRTDGTNTVMIKEKRLTSPIDIKNLICEFDMFYGFVKFVCASEAIVRGLESFGTGQFYSIGL